MGLVVWNSQHCFGYRIRSEFLKINLFEITIKDNEFIFTYLLEKEKET